jgi:hypothetical protein
MKGMVGAKWLIILILIIIFGIIAFTGVQRVLKGVSLG